MRTIIITMIGILISSIILANTFKSGRVENFTEEMVNKIIRSISITPIFKIPEFLSGSKEESAKSMLQSEDSNTIQRALGMELEAYVIPDPSETSLRISINQDVEDAILKFYDSNGNLVRKENIRGYEVDVNISGLNEGLYYILLYSGDEVLNIGFVK